MVPAKTLRRQSSIPPARSGHHCLEATTQMKTIKIRMGRGISEPSRLFYPFPQGHRHLMGLLQSTDNKIHLKS